MFEHKSTQCDPENGAARRCNVHQYVGLTVRRGRGVSYPFTVAYNYGYQLIDERGKIYNWPEFEREIKSGELKID